MFWLKENVLVDLVTEGQNLHNGFKGWCKTILLIIAFIVVKCAEFSEEDISTVQSLNIFLHMKKKLEKLNFVNCEASYILSMYSHQVKFFSEILNLWEVTKYCDDSATRCINLDQVNKIIQEF